MAKSFDTLGKFLNFFEDFAKIFEQESETDHQCLECAKQVNERDTLESVIEHMKTHGYTED